MSQSREGSLGPGLERYEAHLAQWDVGSDQEIELDLMDGSRWRGRVCATPPPTTKFLAETRAVLAVVSEETAGFEIKAKTLARIPVFFHVLQKKSGQGYIADEQIVEQVRILNQKFKSVGVQFFVQGIEDVSKNSWFKKCFPFKNNGNFNRKYLKITKKLSVEPRSTINIFTCEPKYLGHAMLPGWWPEGHYANAIVLHTLSLPGGPSKRYSLGICGVHEMGHYLGLWHTFHPGGDGMALGCTGDGDEVADTPFEAEPAFVC